MAGTSGQRAEFILEQRCHRADAAEIR